MELITRTFKAGAYLAQHLPRPIVEGAVPRLFGCWAYLPTDRRRMVERHQRRATPDLDGRALRRRARMVYRSYGRYYAESLRLPAVPKEELDARMTVDGYEHFEKATAGDVGPIAVLPHLGSWEWCAYWVAQVLGRQLTAVVERLEPPSLFDWFASFRGEIGMKVVPLGPEAGSASIRALRERHVLALLSDRDVAGGGIEVEFLGERTTLPGGPATLALRNGAPLLPIAVYDRPRGGHHTVVRPQVEADRRGTLREDVTRVTQALANELEVLIRAHPEQWHLMQPNWPSDRTPLKL